MDGVKNVLMAVSFRNNSQLNQKTKQWSLWKSPSGFHLFQWFSARICSRVVSVPWHPQVRRGPKPGLCFGEQLEGGKRDGAGLVGAVPAQKLFQNHPTNPEGQTEAAFILLSHFSARVLPGSQPKPRPWFCTLGPCLIPHPTKHSILMGSARRNHLDLGFPT